jgi:DNA-binding XRE family transcriptional regulator
VNQVPHGKVTMKRILRIQNVEELVDHLRTLRHNQSVSQEQLAEFAGLHRNGISKIETGGSDPKLSTIINVMSLLGARLYIEVPDEATRK